MKRPIFLLIFSIVVLSAAHAQTSQSAMSYDTLGSRTQRVITPPAPSKGEGQKKGDAGFVPRKYIPSDYEMADIREFIPVRKKKAGKDTDSDDSKIDTSKVALRTDSNLPVAAIPYQATVTRVDSLAVYAIDGIPLVPNDEE